MTRRKGGDRKARKGKAASAGPRRNATGPESRWGPGEFERFRLSLATMRPKVEAELGGHIGTVRALVEKYDPLELLGGLFVENNLTDPTTYVESEAKGNQCWTEYVFSVFAATPTENLQWLPPDEGVTAQLNAALEGLYSCARNLILLQSDAEVSLDVAELRAQMMLQHLQVRGDSYAEHHTELVQALADEQDGALREKCGFSGEEFLRTLDAIEDQVSARIRAASELVGEIRQVQLETVSRVRSDATSGDAVSEPSSNDASLMPFPKTVDEEFLKSARRQPALGASFWQSTSLIPASLRSCCKCARASPVRTQIFSPKRARGGRRPKPRFGGSRSSESGMNFIAGIR